MREHPIPQDVTGYKFHIIGNMTLKQFAELGLGVFLAIITYSTNLFFFIKWPLIALFVGMGVLAAFVPIAERPLDHWVITFFRILYKPTKFFWKRTPHIPDAFTYKKPLQNVNQEEIVDLTPARKQRVKEFFTSINTTQTYEPWEADQNARVATILESFDSVQVTQTTIRPQKVKPNLGIRVRNLKSPTVTGDQITSQETIVFDQNQSSQNRSATKHTVLQTNQVATQVVIPEMETITVEKTQNLEEETTNNDSQSELHSSFRQHEVAQQAPTPEPTQHATKNISLPFPTKPTEPNKIVGMVLSPSNKILSDAIVEIKNQQGSIVRAVKTNQLGQFFITTALGNGKYIVDVEKDNYTFSSLQLELLGQPVDPLEIRSQGEAIV